VKAADQRAGARRSGGRGDPRDTQPHSRAGETALATVERIRVQDFAPDVAEHAIVQLRELKNALNWKLKSDVQAIRRLADGLEGFERRLGQMSRK
jgi:hypothetical protein